MTKKTLVLRDKDVGLDDPLYWPSVLPAHEILSDPIGAYYLYYSASHAESAVRLAVGDDPLGPYEDNGRIFDDPAAAPQTETPSVLWNPETDRLHMYYHGMLGKNQSTALAFSNDGITWEKHGTIIDAPAYTPGHDHTGYARVHRIGGTWIAHHLMGGGAAAGYGISYSRDGIEWITDPRRLSDSTDISGNPDWRIGWSSSNLLSWNGNLWWIGGIDQKGRSGGGLWKRRIVHAPMLNERSIAGPPRTLVEPTEAWEGVATYTPGIFIEDSTAYVFYGTHGEGFGHIGGAIIEDGGINATP